MAEPSRGLLDTSVIIDLDRIDSDRLPEESTIAAVTLAELAASPHAARMYGRVFAAGRTARSRLADLLIASTAASNGLPLYTRNPNDFTGLERLLTVETI